MKALTVILALAMAVFVAPLATAQTEGEKLPIIFGIWNNCGVPPEVVMGEGTAHIKTFMSPEDNNKTTYRYDYVLQGKATGDTSGAKYVFHDNVSFSVTTTPGVAFTQTMTSILNLIGQGKTPNMKIRVTWRLKVDELGNVVKDVYSYEMVCR